jgi:DNA-binding NarL/FixJ family response regulator
MALRVAILSAVRLYAEGVAEYLAGRADISVIGIARDLSDLEQLLEVKAVDVILCDTSERELAPHVRRLARSFPDARIVAVALTESETEIITWAEAGITSYVPRQASLAQLYTAIFAAMRGEATCSPRITGCLLREFRRRPVASHSAERLTSREVQLLRLLSQGLSNKEIAQTLGISVSTVKNHVHSVLQKLCVRSRVQAAAKAACI